MDEACAQLAVQLESRPEAIDQLERRKMQLEIEEKALEKEKDKTSKQRLKSVREEVKSLEKELKVWLCTLCCTNIPYAVLL